MTVSSPSVTLSLGDQTISAADRLALTATNSTSIPEFAIQDALLDYRTHVQLTLRQKLKDSAVIDNPLIQHSMVEIFHLYEPEIRRRLSPMIAQHYLNEFNRVSPEDIPAKLIYQLADDHAARMVGYFNDTSNEALMQGFARFVNKNIPDKIALDKALDAYGLTAKQMNGYVAAESLQPVKIDTVVRRTPKEKLNTYIQRSLRDRLRIFGTQERHNLEEQSKQLAWGWMASSGQFPEGMMKMWITAEDEKVCKQCGPMHHKKVGIEEKFELPNGNMLFVPGAHVQCRCVVRLWINPGVGEIVDTKIVGKSFDFGKSTRRSKLLPVRGEKFVLKKILSKRDETVSKTEPRDGDGDGYVEDGTPRMRRAAKKASARPAPRVREREEPVLEGLEAAAREQARLDELTRLEQIRQTLERALKLKPEGRLTPKPEGRLRPTTGLSRPQMGLSQPQASLSQPVTPTKPQASLSSVPAEPTQAKPTAGLSQPRTRSTGLTRAQRRERALSSPGRYKLTQQAFMEDRIRRNEERRQELDALRSYVYRPTILFSQVMQTGEEPVLVDREGMVEFTDHATFREGADRSLYRDLKDRVEQRITEKADELNEVGHNEIFHPHPDEDGVELVWSVPEDIMRDAFRAIAYDDHPDELVEVEWVDDMGEPVYDDTLPRAMPLWEIADELKVNKQDLAVTVYEVDEAHAAPESTRPLGRNERLQQQVGISGRYKKVGSPKFHQYLDLPLEYQYLEPADVQDYPLTEEQASLIEDEQSQLPPMDE